MTKEHFQCLPVKNFGSEPQADLVNCPPHYADNAPLECIEVAELIFTPRQMAAVCVFNAFKYIWRRNDKGNARQDLNKALWYLDRYKKYETYKLYQVAAQLRQLAEFFLKELDEKGVKPEMTDEQKNSVISIINEHCDEPV